MAVNKKALNLEMLEFAGFTHTEGWSYPDGTMADDGVPFFPEDFNACLKWLVPKLQIKTLGVAMAYARSISFKLNNGGVCCLIEMNDYSIFTNDRFSETFALAFCLAVQKLKRTE